jgi:hypothetical protein
VRWRQASWWRRAKFSNLLAARLERGQENAQQDFENGEHVGRVAGVLWQRQCDG